MSRAAPSVLPVLHREDLPADRVRPRASRSSSPLSLTRQESGDPGDAGRYRRLTRKDAGDGLGAAARRRRWRGPVCCAATRATSCWPASRHEESVSLTTRHLTR